MMDVRRSSFAFAIISLLVVFGQCASWKGPCYQRPGFDNTDNITLLILKTQCKNGTVVWHHPSGHLHLDYDVGHGPRFTFCIVKWWITHHGDFTDLTDGRNASMPKPTNAEPSCTRSSADGRVLLSLGSLKKPNYLTSFKYFTVHDNSCGN